MNPIMNEHDLKRWKAKFTSIVWRCDDAFLGHALGFADALGKREEFEKKIEQMAFPTFFGKPAKTIVAADGLCSFYFSIFLETDMRKEHEGTAHERWIQKEGARFAMNGGLIFHPAWRKCPHDGNMERTGKCEICGGESGHREVADYARGSWSIHT